jgi:hypothetical protein
MVYYHCFLASLLVQIRKVLRKSEDSGIEWNIGASNEVGLEINTRKTRYMSVSGHPFAERIVI